VQGIPQQTNTIDCQMFICKFFELQLLIGEVGFLVSHHRPRRPGKTSRNKSRSCLNLWRLHILRSVPFLFLKLRLQVVVVGLPLLAVNEVAGADLGHDFVLTTLNWGRCAASIHHTGVDKAWLPGSASHSWVPSCCPCWREYVNRMNLDSMQSIWLVYLYCRVAENQPRITENSTPY
jgi:hypothetical protein